MWAEDEVMTMLDEHFQKYISGKKYVSLKYLIKM